MNDQDVRPRRGHVRHSRVPQTPSRFWRGLVIGGLVCSVFWAVVVAAVVHFA